MAKHPDKFGKNIIERDVAEIWNEGKLMGIIYPTDKGINVESKYLTDNPKRAIKIDSGKLVSILSIPSIRINLN